MITGNGQYYDICKEANSTHGNIFAIQLNP